MGIYRQTLEGSPWPMSKNDRIVPMQYLENSKNPIPTKFKILEIEEYGALLYVKIQYPNCTNFEGCKILIYQGLSKKYLLKCSKIDPHFFPSSKLIARFRPDKQGEQLAKQFIQILSKTHP